ncbi:ABC transporter permease [Gloeocapsa sp. PCC 73106]|uniref:ABC transporter permease n=1 Tax=Gloeocapsa sp. PCC 73106 TaxID=102232 RepID=UPI0002AD1BE4|nr:ABC transporter permease [Gloeocapsa sp. PCC 73106]ELR98014.1 ABC-2 type transporter [Gloeocapsa sp. PCC 73106]
MSLLINIIAIFRKELYGYFASPLAYSVAGIFWLISGYFFIVLLFDEAGIIQEVARREQMGLTLPPIDVAYIFLRDFFTLMGTIVLFILPILSMGLYAEEKKLGTLELLATSPISNLAIALGKLLGVLTFFITLLIPLVIYQIIVFSQANPAVEPSVPCLAYLGLILLASAVLSLGMFISALTENNLIAALFTFTLVLLLWVIDLIADNLGGLLGEVLSHLSLLTHYDNLIQGVFTTSSLFLFLSYVVLGLFLTTQWLQALGFMRD